MVGKGMGEEGRGWGGGEGVEGKGKVWGKVTRDSLKKGKMDNVRVDAFRLLFIHLFMSFIYFVVYLSIYSRYFNSVCVPCLYLFPFSLSRHPRSGFL